MKRLVRYLRRNWVSAISVIAIIVVWEIVSHIVPKSPLRDSPIVPPLEYVFGRALIGLSDYWKIDMWAPVPELGGERTLFGALLAIGYHSSLTIFRVAAGLAVGSIVGTLLGLAVAWSSVARQLTAPTLHLIRMCPLLAMIPLFQFWFGATNVGAIAFVAYGVGVVFLIGTINAVTNLPRKYIEAARTMGASDFLILRAVALPGILPELFTSFYLTLGLAWSAVIGAEYIGVESGIGRMIIWAEYFSNTGRMMIVAIIIFIYASLSIVLLRHIQERVLRWMPQQAPSRPLADATQPVDAKTAIP